MPNNLKRKYTVEQLEAWIRESFYRSVYDQRMTWHLLVPIVHKYRSH